MVSVIVAAYECSSILKIVLRSLADQDYRDAYEVLVCDDGSLSDTIHVIREMAELGLNIRYIWQPHVGRRVARSRNNAIRCAQGEILVLLDGDIIVRRDFLSRHVSAHVKSGLVICGSRRWLQVTESQWNELCELDVAGIWGHCEKLPLESERPWQLIECRGEFPWRACSGFNFSVQKHCEVVFDENFSGYGFEDSELACRLFQRHRYAFVCPPSIECIHVEFGKRRRLAEIHRLSSHEQIVQYIANIFYFESLYPEMNLGCILDCLAMFDINPESQRWRVLSPSDFLRRDHQTAICAARQWHYQSQSCEGRIRDSV